MSFLPLNMEPVTGDVQCHTELEEQHVLWVEVTQGGHQTHGGTAVNQHIQHATQFTACPKYMFRHQHYENSNHINS